MKQIIRNRRMVMTTTHALLGLFGLIVVGWLFANKQRALIAVGVTICMVILYIILNTDLIPLPNIQIGIE